MVMVKPTGTRIKDNYPAYDIREKDPNAQRELFDTSDEDHVNLCMPTPLQEVYGQGSGLSSRKKATAANVKLEPRRDDDSDEDDDTMQGTRGATNYVDGANDMNNADQSSDSRSHPTTGSDPARRDKRPYTLNASDPTTTS